jgi:hypothetical protein
MHSLADPRIFSAVLVGRFITGMALGGGALFGLEARNPYYFVAEGFSEGAVIGALFYLWRRQISLRTLEGEAYARMQTFRNQQIRDHLQMIALRCGDDPLIIRNVQEITRLLELSSAPPRKENLGSGAAGLT